MAKNQITFFATTPDIVSVLSALEVIEPLRYTKAGLFNTSRPQIHSSYLDIPDFGRTTHPNAVGNQMYLLSSPATQIKVRDVPQKGGGFLFAIDQLENPDSIVLRPGGWYGNDVILCGMIGTVSEGPESKRLFAVVVKAFRKHLTKQQGFLVGSEARVAWNAGARLTIGASSLLEFDLRRESVSR